MIFVSAEQWSIRKCRHSVGVLAASIPWALSLWMGLGRTALSILRPQGQVSISPAIGRMSRSRSPRRVEGGVVTRGGKSPSLSLSYHVLIETGYGI